MHEGRLYRHEAFDRHASSCVSASWIDAGMPDHTCDKSPASLPYELSHEQRERQHYHMNDCIQHT